MRTILAIAVVSCLAAGHAAAQGQEAKGGTVYKPGNGVSAPVLIKEVKPQYTPDAMRARVQGTVPLECVVKADGRVGDCTVTKSLDDGLDKEAVKAAQRWVFEPGKKDGKPVRVQISLELTFTLR